MAHENLLHALDHQALHLRDQHGSRDVFEFDLTLWSLLNRLSQERPHDIAAQFSLPDSTVKLLGAATQDKLAKLASGIFISFALETSEAAVLELLNKPYDPVVFLNRSIDEFDAGYWLLLSKMALRDPSFAQECFGVSAQLVQATANATDSQLRELASRTVTHFSIRCSSQAVEDILTSDDPTYPILKKLQQTLNRRAKA